MYTNSFEQYFRPRGTAVLGIEDTAAAAAVHGGYVCLKRCKIKRILFALETAVAADTTLPVLEFNRRPTIASAVGEVVMGTLTLPDLTAVGQVVMKDITPVTFEPGEELSVELLTQGVDGGGAAGTGYYSFEIEDFPEDDRNLSSLVRSV